MVAKESPNCVKILASKEISSSDLSLAIAQERVEIKVTNSQGFNLTTSR